MATPSGNIPKPTSIDESSQLNNSLGTFGQMPPLNAAKDDTSAINMVNSKPHFLKGFHAPPCKDDTESRGIISGISGRLAAVARKKVMHNRNHNGMPQLDISFWLPSNESEISDESVANLILSKHPHIKCFVYKLGDAYTDSRTMRTSLTFRIVYGADDDGVLAFEEANNIHKSLYQRIPIEFPGAECR